MKRRYKLIIIILLSSILTYMIYFLNKVEKINLVALGDGISSGETSYNIDGISFNDYLKEYFENKKLLKKYNNQYSYENNNLKDLINDIDNNIINNNKHIKQLLREASFITISIGEEELVKLAITNDLNLKYLKDTINNYDILLKKIKEVSEATIVVIGFYENKYLDKTNVIILNSELTNLAKKYDVIFINISDIMLNKEYFVDSNSYYFNYKGHEEIALMIINSI